MIPPWSRIPTAALFGILGVVSSARSQQPPPDCTAAIHNQFDFWVGDWEVTDSAGTRQLGINRITQEEANCLIHEHWQGGPGGTGGATGQSFNFYDRTSGRWHQVWVSSNGNVLWLSGGLQGTSMVLEGESAAPSGQVRNRIMWTPYPDGRVRQQWLIDRGQGWQASFDGWYRRRN